MTATDRKSTDLSTARYRIEDALAAAGVAADVSVSDDRVELAAADADALAKAVAAAKAAGVVKDGAGVVAYMRLA